MIEWVGPLLRDWLTSSDAAVSVLLADLPSPPGEWGPLDVQVYDEANTGWLALREAPQGFPSPEQAAISIFQVDDYVVEAFGKVGPDGAHHEFVLPVAVAVLVHELTARRGRGQVARIQRAVLDSLATLFQPDHAGARRTGAISLGTPRVSVLAEPAKMGHAILAGLITLEIPIVAAASVLRPA